MIMFKIDTHKCIELIDLATCGFYLFLFKIILFYV